MSAFIIAGHYFETMPRSDLQLLQAYVDREDEAAFAELVTRHRDWMYAAARQRLGDAVLADDATQIVFVLLADKAPSLLAVNRQSIAAWLFRTLHFSCARLSRTRKRQRRIELASVSNRIAVASKNAAGCDATRLILEDTISQLTPDERELIVLRFYQRHSWEQIALALEISADAARKRLARTLDDVRAILLRDGVEAGAESLVSSAVETPPDANRLTRTIRSQARINHLAKGAFEMMTRSQAIEFTVMTAEFFVNDVEANLEFFEKLGFRHRWSETTDAAGRIPRASLAGGAARIWLRRASEADGTRPEKGVGVFFWIDGGEEGLIAHRNAIAAQNISVSPFVDDHTLRSFTVVSPDKHRIGFFTSRTV